MVRDVHFADVVHTSDSFSSYAALVEVIDSPILGLCFDQMMGVADKSHIVIREPVVHQGMVQVNLVSLLFSWQMDSLGRC